MMRLQAGNDREHSIYDVLIAGGRAVYFVNLYAALGSNLERLPWLMRIIAENAIRHAPSTQAEALAPLLEWLTTRRSESEISFWPARLLMHDTTCVPALVDIAAMRDAVADAGGDPVLLNPRLPVDVSVDHSIAVDVFGTGAALGANMRREIERNHERYRLMKWAAGSFRNMTVHAPGTGIMHTMNLEQLSRVVTVDEQHGVATAMPDTLIGTDSHTPMVNGIGVLGWGVGGLEAESVMFGMPVMLRLPEVIGVRLTGALKEGALSTDLALAVTERLRRHGVSGQFVEYFGPGVSSLSAGDRAVVANMAPEYGASSGYFPIDRETIRYLAQIGRSSAEQELVEVVARYQGLWLDPMATPDYTETIEFDLGDVNISLAGPRRPQDRLSPALASGAIAKLYGRPLDESAPREGTVPPDGAVAIAAIASCTNTSDPRLLVAAALVARKARQFGLKPPSWVKTSLAPGSPAAGRYLARGGLLDDLAAVGFDIVGYGCTTCIGNSGPLVPAMSTAIARGLAAATVLSGNRNFPGRIHPEIEAVFLASPPLVVAYALLGDVRRNILADPLGVDPNGRPVFLRDVWPSSAEIDEAAHRALAPEDFGGAFAEAEASGPWLELDAPAASRFPWDASSTYVRSPPFASAGQPLRLGRYSARALLVLGDDITTDHISPAGQIPADSEAARYLVERGENPRDLNVFAARRGNWEVMLRGVFSNPGVRNLADPFLPPGTVRYAGAVLPLWEAASRYQMEGTSLVIMAGERYGAGSSRDWAAKGVALLGVRAVLASSFERIHRSNLVGMGVLPLRLPADRHPATLGVSPEDWIEIDAPTAALRPRGIIPVEIRHAGGGIERFEAIAAVETALEVKTLRAGGILPLILREIAGTAGAAPAAVSTH